MSEVISPIKGIVEAVHLQEELTQDFAIWLKPLGGPTLWLVELDHVTQVAVGRSPIQNNESLAGKDR